GARRTNPQAKEPSCAPSSSMRSSSLRSNMDNVHKFSLGRPRPSQASFDSSLPRQRQPLTHQTFWTPSQTQEQRPADVHRSYTHIGHTPYPSRSDYRHPHERNFDDSYIRTDRDTALLQRTKQ